MQSLKLFHQGTSQWGNIIVTMLIAVGITAIVAILINTMVMGNGSMQKQARDTLDLSGIKTYILEKIDCQKTMPRDFAASCEQKNYIDIVGKDGKPIVVSAGVLGSPLGGFAIRAICYNQKHKLTVETRSLLPRGQEDGSWQDLFQGARLCGLMYPAAEDSSTEQRHNMTWLEYYPTGNFRANGGELLVTLEKIYGNATCSHRFIGLDQQITDKGLFRLDRHGLLRLQVSLQGCRGKNQSQLLELTDPHVTLIKQGQNTWRIEIVDSLSGNALRSGHSIWQMTAEPQSH